ncbi:uncharacterized protein LOC122385566 [Amphibalanus amphitrite]|uniref:uncharacterized protein LOC122385566 n=1 Tax=Amphibalanus amphitrite TaxID=1232801 RepID=UPI001C900C5A|nr:uncharacterized protein LOC122385566 [Amphibalanus amphitrite]
MYIRFLVYLIINSSIHKIYASSRNESPGLTGYSNHTLRELGDLLHGYKFFDNSDYPTQSLPGGIIYHPNEMLQVLRVPEERADTHGIDSSRLWFDSAGSALVNYFVDTNTHPNVQKFEASLKVWSPYTCIQFKKLPNHKCGYFKEPAVCLKDEGADVCSFSTGNRHKINGGYAQGTGVEGCEDNETARGLGMLLGFIRITLRTDRDQFVTVNYHNFKPDKVKSGGTVEAKWKKAWSIGRKCKKGDTFQTSTPVPYDYLTLMSRSENDFGDDDCRVIFVTKDPRHQHMLDFIKYAGPFTTHLDRYLLNVMYKCNEKWTKSCTSQGKTPPKCKNFGYLSKDCKCICQKGITGASCEHAGTGATIPTLDRAGTIVEHPAAGLFTLKKYSKMGTSPPYPNADFKYTQYATIIIKAKSAQTTISVKVFEPGSVAAKVKKSESKLMKELNERDCELGMRLYWGDFPTGRLRTECFSTFVTNEPEVNAVFLRPKTQQVGLVFIARQGQLLGSADFTKEMLESLQFEVSFPPNASSQLKVEKVNDGSDQQRRDGSGTGDSGSTGGADGTSGDGSTGGGSSTGGDGSTGGNNSTGGDGSSSGNNTTGGDGSTAGDGFAGTGDSSKNGTDGASGNRSASIMSEMKNVSRVWLVAVPLLLILLFLACSCRAARKKSDEETLVSNFDQALDEDNDDESDSSSDSDSDAFCTVL